VVWPRSCFVFHVHYDDCVGVVTGCRQHRTAIYGGQLFVSDMHEKNNPARAGDIVIVLPGDSVIVLWSSLLLVVR
jgi:hypothetical protein